MRRTRNVKVPHAKADESWLSFLVNRTMENRQAL
jgi:hypothetical protein